MSGAFRVPEDLATFDLKISEVRTILDNRRRRASVATRLNGLPQKKLDLESQLEVLAAEETKLLEAAVNAGAAPGE